MQPTLFIGIGTAGASIIGNVHGRLFPGGAVNPLTPARFLAVDPQQRLMYDGAALGKLNHAELGGLTAATTLPTHVGDSVYSSAFPQGFSIAPAVNFTNGCGQIRSNGRYYHFVKNDGLVPFIQGRINELLSVYAPGADVTLNVIITAILSNATGSGMFLDVAYLVRQILRTLGGHIPVSVQAVLLCGSVAERTSHGDNAIRSALNGYAAIRELEWWSSIAPRRGVAYEFKAGSTVVTGNVGDAPFDYVWLFQHGNEKGRVLPGIHDYVLTAGQCLTEIFRGSEVAGGILNILAGFNPATGNYVGSLGQSSLEVPLEAIVRQAALQRLGHLSASLLEAGSVKFEEAVSDSLHLAEQGTLAETLWKPVENAKQNWRLYLANATDERQIVSSDQQGESDTGIEITQQTKLYVEEMAHRCNEVRSWLKTKFANFVGSGSLVQCIQLLRKAEAFVKANTPGSGAALFNSGSKQTLLANVESAAERRLFTGEKTRQASLGAAVTDYFQLYVEPVTLSARNELSVQTRKHFLTLCAQIADLRNRLESFLRDVIAPSLIEFQTQRDALTTKLGDVNRMDEPSRFPFLPARQEELLADLNHTGVDGLFRQVLERLLLDHVLGEDALTSFSFENLQQHPPRVGYAGACVAVLTKELREHVIEHYRPSIVGIVSIETEIEWFVRHVVERYIAAIQGHNPKAVHEVDLLAQPFLGDTTNLKANLATALSDPAATPTAVREAEVDNTAQALILHQAKLAHVWWQTPTPVQGEASLATFNDGLNKLRGWLPAADTFKITPIPNYPSHLLQFTSAKGPVAFAELSQVSSLAAVFHGSSEKVQMVQMGFPPHADQRFVPASALTGPVRHATWHFDLRKPTPTALREAIENFWFAQTQKLVTHSVKFDEFKLATHLKDSFVAGTLVGHSCEDVVDTLLAYSVLQHELTRRRVKYLGCIVGALSAGVYGGQDALRTYYSEFLIVEIQNCLATHNPKIAATLNDHLAVLTHVRDGITSVGLHTEPWTVWEPIVASDYKP